MTIKILDSTFPNHVGAAFITFMTFGGIFLFLSQYTKLLQLLLLAVHLTIAIPFLQYCPLGHNETLICTKYFGKDSYSVSLFLSLIANT